MCLCMCLTDLLTISDVLREADPTLLLYSPSSTEGEREGVLKALVPELDSGSFRYGLLMLQSVWPPWWSL